MLRPRPASRFRRTSTRRRMRRRSRVSASTCRSPTARRIASRLPGHRSARHARRLQHPAADLDPVLRTDRPLDGDEHEHLPRRARRPRDRDQSVRVGARGRTRCTSRATTSSRRTRRTSSSSRAACTTRAASRSPRRLPARPQLRPDEGSCRRRRTGRRSSTRCRWRWRAVPTRVTSPTSSLFTTQSITAISEKIRAQLHGRLR